VVSRTPADSAQFTKDLDEIRARSVMTAKQERVRNYLQGLRDKAAIVDNRAAVLQANQQAARS